MSCLLLNVYETRIPTQHLFAVNYLVDNFVFNMLMYRRTVDVELKFFLVTKMCIIKIIVHRRFYININMC